jgi:4-hydroxy-tetrahydrodipicolinate reductase
MVKMIMHGCNGHMGQVITQLVEQDAEIEIVAGIDPFTEKENSYPVFAGIEDCNVAADVIVDFAAVAAVDALLDYAKKTGTPVVLCTTGLTEEQLAKVKETSQDVAILKSANMSLGINTLLKLLKDAAKVFGTAGYDIEIVEQHHRLKKDAPSGTALALADSVNEALGNEYAYVYDRSDRSQQRPDKEIGISSVRGGTIVGVHDVIFAGTDEVITFQHTAYSKSVFAKGAIEAGKFLAGKPAGMYDMADVIAAK